VRWPRAYPCCICCGVDKAAAKPGHRGLCRPCYRAEEAAGRSDNWPDSTGTYNPARLLANLVGVATAARMLSLPAATVGEWARKGTPPDRAHDARRALAAVCSGEMKPTEDGSYAA
jgi:hypothetical protein